MKKEPHKRLGRGLDSLINGGLGKPAQKVTPPEVKIDGLRLEPSDSAKNKTTPPPAKKYYTEKPVKKDELMEDLNDLLKKTQEEAEQEAKEETKRKEIWSNSINEEENLSRESAGEVPPADKKMEAPKVEKPNFPNVTPDTPSAQKKDRQKENNASVGTGQGVFMLVPVAGITVSPYQQRREISPAAIRELAESIRSEGLMQPIVVRTIPTGGYELIAGHRRLRACESIGMEVVPARVVTVADSSAAVMGLIENLQRVDLNPVEEARGYGMLLTDFNLSQDQIAQRVGKDRSTVANSLRLLLLELEILNYVAKGQLTLGHAKVLLGLQEGSQRVMLARQAVEQALSVRQMEALTRRAGNVAESGGSNVKTKRLASETEIAVIKELQQKLVARLNAPVELKHGHKGGSVKIFYKSNAELEAILKKMGM